VTDIPHDSHQDRPAAPRAWIPRSSGPFILTAFIRPLWAVPIWRDVMQGLARRRALSLAALIAPLALAGCLAAPMRDAPRTMQLGENGPVIAGPAGYCVDRSQSRTDGAAGFVLLGSCAALSGRAEAPAPRRIAILSATITPSELGARPFQTAFPQLRRFFSSPEGRATLSRKGRAETVKVEEIDTDGALFILHLSDTAPGPGGRLQPHSVRVLTAIGGRIISLSVLGLADRPLSPKAMDALARTFAAAVEDANAPRGPDQ